MSAMPGRRNWNLTPIFLLLAACTSALPAHEEVDFIDDAAITTRIKAQLVQERLPSAPLIEVQTLHGSVLLRGQVQSPADKTRAEIIARTTPQVREVRSLLTSPPAPAATP
ncbi:BON domain-containing protein [Acidovorax sp. HDW3]|uniref:BON domain-containing protein n=1 Tax=Acidovorax sp. HDW3 TaxID=2714923 RepID=UPI00140BA929|nr:BON domain-containing protein [Acidovorax sp. HDW3]QIL43243.1 BON domain-containing protein [Acidovorax sp. HDW3]